MKFLFKLLALTTLVVFYSCSKGGGSGSATSVAPTNLTVTATVNPDNSGNVSFTASATNAVSYDYSFDNGVYQSSTTGTLTYKYPTTGTYTVTVTATSASGLTATKSITVSIISSGAMSLVWSDEFNTDGSPDPTKWTYDLGAGGWGNNELEYYTNRLNNVFISNGTLKIVANKESYMGSNYTSSRMKTQGLYAYTYGRMDVRAKLPSTLGVWPAIWMLGSDITNIPWPGCGEMDIMEYRVSDLNKIYGTLHYPTEQNPNGDGSSTIVPGVSIGFHTYSVDWSPSTIQISVDSIPYYTFANSSSLPFNNNFFIILNMAIGGNFAGAVSPSFTSDTLEIDYVRVYQ